MMAVVAIVNSVPVVSVWIGPVVAVRVIPIVPRITVIIAAWVSNPDSHNSWNSDVNLGVRTLHGNESEYTCHQCNQKNLFITFPFYLFPFLVCCFARDRKTPERVAWAH
jgi:hypothetical protein